MCFNGIKFDEQQGAGHQVITIAIMLVICSGLAHSVWNLFTKRSMNKFVFLWSIHIGSFLILLPFFLIELLNSSISIQGWLLLGVSILLQSAYVLLLIQAFRIGEMSQMYPIMRGTGAFLVPVVSVMFFNESLSLAGWLGILCIVAGLFVIGLRQSSGAAWSVKPVLIALLTGLCITSYTLVDKQVLQHISPIALIQLSNIGYLAVLTRPTLRTLPDLKKEWSRNKRILLLGTVLSPGSYLIFLYAMKLAPLSHIAPIREIGTVFGTLFGVWLLKESQGLQRIAWSAVIVAGVFIIGAWG